MNLEKVPFCDKLLRKGKLSHPEKPEMAAPEAAQYTSTSVTSFEGRIECRN